MCGFEMASVRMANKCCSVDQHLMCKIAITLQKRTARVHLQACCAKSRLDCMNSKLAAIDGIMATAHRFESCHEAVARKFSEQLCTCGSHCVHAIGMQANAGGHQSNRGQEHAQPVRDRSRHLTPLNSGFKCF